MVKIAINKLLGNGKRGFALTVPRIFIEDNKIQKSEELSIYRGNVAGVDALIIIPSKNFKGNLIQDRSQCNEQNCSNVPDQKKAIKNQVNKK